MFNCYYRPENIPVNVIVRDVSSPTLICEVVEITGGVAIVDLAANKRFIEPKLEFRSVTPSERIATGNIIPVDSSQFLRPSLEDFQRVSSVLSAIDDKFSYEAAREKFEQSLKAAASEPALEPTPEPTPEPVK